MKPALKPILALAALAVVGVVAWRAWAPRPDERATLSGYLQGDDLYLAAPAAGAVTGLYVVEGQRVEAGSPLFAIDPAAASAQREQVAARGQRTASDVAVAEALSRQAREEAVAARAVEEGAKRDYARLLAVQRDNAQAVTALQVDQARAAAESAEARRRAAEQAAAAASARIPGIRTAAAETSAALKEIDVRLGQLAQKAPAAGRVQTVYLQAGEWATPNQPVVALLPDGRLKLRFYVPETQAAAYRPGGLVRFGCDGCRAGLQARISKLADRPEFTPPVIYSRKIREKLVFLAEAVPLDPQGLAPGQPIDVEPLSGAAR